MKSTLLFSAGILLLLLSAHAQHSGKNEVSPFLKTPGPKRSINPHTPVYSSKKKDTVGILEFDYPKVAKKFASLFPQAIRQEWIKEQGALFVSFFRNGCKVSAVFTMNGHMSYYIVNRDTTDLPWHILQRVKHDYASSAIINNKEIGFDGNTMHELVLESDSGYVQVRVFDNEFTEIQKLRKTGK